MADGLFAVDHVVRESRRRCDVPLALFDAWAEQWLTMADESTRIIDVEEGRKRSTAQRAYTVNDHEPAGVDLESMRCMASRMACAC